MDREIEGRIKLIGETQLIGAKGFKKRELVVTTDEEYPQHIMVEFINDKTDLLDRFQVGQQVTVGINLRGREWINPQGEAKYFNGIQGWRIKSLADVNLIPADINAPVDLSEEDPNDLPF